MVYRVVKSLLILIINNFYRIKVRNGHRVPLKDPLIIVSNHTNAFLDSLSMSIVLKQNMFSLPRGNVFLNSSKVLKWLFTGIGMIPIYRKLEGAENLKRNDETFERCFKIMKDKGTIHIYPEAICIYERKLKSIKKGAARILLGAEERNDYSLNSKVIVCGLIYEEAAQFNTNLLFNFSKPFSLRESIDIYKENNVLGINHLTKKIGEKMLPNIVHVENKQLVNLVRNIELIYRSELAIRNRMDPKNQSHQFFLSKHIANAINYFNSNDIEQLNGLAERIGKYLKTLKRASFLDKDIHHSLGLNHILKGIFLTLLLPFCLWGLINNFLILIISKIIADKVVKRIEFRGSVLFLSGMCSVLLLYPLQMIFFYLYFDSIVYLAIYMLLLPITSRLAFLFSREYVSWFNMFKGYIMKLLRLSEFKNLQKERTALIEELDLMVIGYRKRHLK